VAVMNNRGVVQIAFLPILLFVIIVLVLTAIIFSFLPSLAISACLAVLGGFFVYNSISSLDKKSYQMVFGVGLIFILGSLFVGVVQPFSVFGDEFRWESGSFYAGSVGYNWFWLTGRGPSGQLNDNTSSSYLSSDNLLLSSRYVSSRYWTVWRASPDLGARCNNVTSSVSNCTGDVAYWRYNVFVDNKQAGYFGSLSFIPSLYENNDNQFAIDMTTGSSSTFYNNDPCKGITDTYLYNLCRSKYISIGRGLIHTSFSSNVFNKSLSLIDYDKTKLNHDVKVFLEPKVLQRKYPSGGGGTYYINPTNIAAMNEGKRIFLVDMGIVPKEEYYAKIGMTGRSGCVSSGCSYSSGGQGIERIYNFDITSFPELVEQFKNKGKQVYSSQFYVEPEACGNTTDYITRMFTVKGGDKISLTPEVGEIGFTDFKTFCHTLPVLKQAGGITFEQDYEPYEALQRGETITIPSGQVWIFFYKGLPSSNVLTYCADGEGIYDYATNRCEVVPTIEYICVSGVFDSVSKTCLVQANTVNVCDNGVYDQVLDACVVTAVNNYCSQGEYDAELDVCVVEKNVVVDCVEGDYDEINDVCVVNPMIVQGKTNVMKLIILGVVVGSAGLLVFLFLKRAFFKKRRN